VLPAFCRSERFESRGIERYGFHGLSYCYLIEELGRVAGSRPRKARVVLAHLGNGLVWRRTGWKRHDTSMVSLRRGSADEQPSVI